MGHDMADDDISHLQMTEIIPTKKDRYYFDKDMFDDLKHILVLKVYSHQLTSEFKPVQAEKMPRPNLFTSSANQIADNAATQARNILFIDDNNIEFNDLRYPPFSPRWSYSFEGQLINNGADNFLQEKMHQELFQRLQHRPKQGLFYRLISFNGLKINLLGQESLLRNIIKMSALCWSRCIYRHPPFAEAIWKHWKSNLTEHSQQTTQDRFPPKWQNIPHIANNIIKACPFCITTDSNLDRRCGNLEHLHLYCPSPILCKARAHCHQKLEDALYDLYDYASMREYGVSIEDAQQKSVLQERMENAAKSTELAERYIVRNKKLYLESRPQNVAILSEEAVGRAILLNRLPNERILDYQNYPLTCRLGFIQFLPEEDFKIDSATIIDVGFTGIFPKAIIHELHTYAREVKHTSQDPNNFTSLINGLITAFIYRPIIMQKVIQLMIVKKK